MSIIYTCDGYRPIPKGTWIGDYEIAEMRDAARAFAARAAAA